MSRQTNSDYYATRAQAERLLSENASDPRAAAAHSELAARYGALLQDWEPEAVANFQARQVGRTSL